MCYLIISVPLDARYSNNIVLFNKHGFTNISLMNIYNDKLNHLTTRCILFGRKPLLDIYHLDINHCWTLTTARHILFGHKPSLDIYYLDINHG